MSSVFLFATNWYSTAGMYNHWLNQPPVVRHWASLAVWGYDR